MRGPVFIVVTLLGVWTSTAAMASEPALRSSEPAPSSAGFGCSLTMAPAIGAVRPREPFVVTDRAWVKRDPRAKQWVAARAERSAAVAADVAATRHAAGSGLGQLVVLVGLVMLAAFIPSPKALLRRRSHALAIRAALREPGVLAREGAISLAVDERGALSVTGDHGTLSRSER